MKSEILVVLWFRTFSYVLIQCQGGKTAAMNEWLVIINLGSVLRPIIKTGHHSAVRRNIPKWKTFKKAALEKNRRLLDRRDVCTALCLVKTKQSISAQTCYTNCQTQWWKGDDLVFGHLLVITDHEVLCIPMSNVSIISQM